MLKTLIFGHRGFPAEYPENSIQGFRYAINHHIDGIEFDVHLTKDNVPVIIHDEKINRTTDGHGFVKDYTLDELRQFSLDNYEPIPTLSELLDLVENKDIYLNLEFKTNKIHYRGIENIVIKMMNEYHLCHPVIYSSFNMDSIKIAQKIDSNQKYCFLSVRKIKNPQMFMQKYHLDALHLKFFQENIENQESIFTVNHRLRLRFLFNKKIKGIFTNDFERANKIKNEIQS
ncbi:glycerophosphodiester phosphodiesterase family protein [Apilactobacillus micheneri]|uniref:Glycerophosphodiester phosphodiesterase n=1 Tax=Apilactobacillus micheneri TaxID=1899430 RepID=A0A9Q8ING6_9LACO|nr:glycerophosphodiester phosphodiesterase family protein [Apilactobacillus micheneri]TPR39225.1 glycerophosphodiester phosphodiesterase [Apilactobacillus micheneri]TPR43130.1 glycerophosphodiester phosphodiesterase [Apilactobacillus micheneri]TPR44110.1 glycerophosphodiester phosphodiesterase [Apilactobacillus micheneri]TPR50976.1 glycerophosphodiester phosphodiesterase [Apilactobacillus micheneri]